MTVEIDVDKREPIEYKLLTLDAGDIQFKTNNQLIRIERKKYSDLLSSYNSGRLAIQLNVLRGSCNIPILAVVGYPNLFNLIERCTFRNMLLSVKLTGVIVERFDNEDDFKARIPELITYFKNIEHISMIPYRYSNPKLGSLMWVSGIGFRNANRLLDTWQNSVIDIYLAPKQALTKIVGSVLADRFSQAIRKPVKTSNLEKDLALWD